MSLRATRRFVAVMLGTFLTVLPAQAEHFRVTFENLQPTGGFSLTPAWVGIHDGTFDVFDGGAVASSELEALAEVGNTAPLSAAFNATANGADTTLTAGAPPIFQPGETATREINSGAGNTFFSYASMIIPSNDTFIGNSNPMGIDLSGLGPNGTLTVDVTRFYDAGTEINDPTDGAAFSTDAPNGGGGGTAENGVITLDDFASFNAEFLNTNTPLGQVTAPLQNVIGRFTITAIPEPGAAGFLGALGVALAAFRRRRRQ